MRARVYSILCDADSTNQPDYPHSQQFTMPEMGDSAIILSAVELPGGYFRVTWWERV